jgi:hypothetical protein
MSFLMPNQIFNSPKKLKTTPAARWQPKPPPLLAAQRSYSAERRPNDAPTQK